MSFPDCHICRSPRFRSLFSALSPIFSLIVLLIVFTVIIFPSALCGQSSISTTSGPGQYPGQVQTSAQNPLFGSVAEAKPTPGVLSLTFSDAIERALRQNLAGLLSEYNTIEARGEKWQQLSDLLPNINADVQETRQKESLEALGFNGSLFPGTTFPRVIGPFSYFDARVSATQRVFDWKSIQKYRSSVVGERAAKFNLQDARDLVVLATGNAYLQAIAGAARVDTTQAQVDTGGGAL